MKQEGRVVCKSGREEGMESWSGGVLEDCSHGPAGPVRTARRAVATLPRGNFDGTALAAEKLGGGEAAFSFELHIQQRQRTRASSNDEFVL